MSYQETAYEVMKLFLTDFTEEELKRCIACAYDEKFDTEAIAPNQVEIYLNQSWIMTSFDSSKIPKTELDNQDPILKQVEDALANKKLSGSQPSVYWKTHY